MAWFDESVFYHIYPLGLVGAPKKTNIQNRYLESKKSFLGSIIWWTLDAMPCI